MLNQDIGAKYGAGMDLAAEKVMLGMCVTVERFDWRAAAKERQKQLAEWDAMTQLNRYRAVAGRDLHSVSATASEGCLQELAERILGV
jgi:hypothetical protein